MVGKNKMEQENKQMFKNNVSLVNTMKGVFDQDKWSLVANELKAENLKLASYDNTLIPLLGDIKGKKILDGHLFLVYR